MAKRGQGLSTRFPQLDLLPKFVNQYLSVGVTRLLSARTPALGLRKVRRACLRSYSY
jgi:hypothetical protein